MKKRKSLNDNYMKYRRDMEEFDEDLHSTGGNGKRTRDKSDETETKRLIEKIQKGDRRAFSRLVERYQSQVAGIAYRVVGDYDDAKDVTQLVFVKTADNLYRYDPSKRFSTWLYRITVNASIDYLRKHKRHAHDQIDNYAESLENLEASPDQVYHRKYLRYLILKAAERLSAKQRAAFILKDMEGHDVREVAEIMNMPEATVRWYIHRARLRLRRELKSSLSTDPWSGNYFSQYVSN